MSEQIVRPNKVVYLTYEIKDSLNGDIIERIDIPVGYVHGGYSDLFSRIEGALEGHKVGDIVHVTLSPEEGFGPYDPTLTFTDDIGNVPPEYRRIGAEAVFENGQGDQITMVVNRIENGTLTLDGNHPLAGKTVTFRVTISSIRDAKKEEMEHGVPEDYYLSSLH